MQPQQTFSGPRRKSLFGFIIALLAIPGLMFNLWPVLSSWTAWGVDYNQFYSGGRLVGTGHVYDWDALRKVEAEHGPEVPTGRLPVVLYGHKLLGLLPYDIARCLWTVGGVAAMIAFSAFWPGTRRLYMMVALAWSMSGTLALLFGQDLPYWLMFFTAGLVLIERKHPVSAGVAFSLCVCKFHLALGIPVMLVSQKRWKTLIAGAVATFVWLACCFVLEGTQWPMQYMKFEKMPSFSPAPQRMPNLHGLVSWFPWPNALETISALAILFLLWLVCRRATDVGAAGAAAATCGFLVSHHSYGGDCTLLIPLAVLTIQRQGAPSWMKIWAGIMLSPVPVVLLISEQSFVSQALIVGFVVTAVLNIRTEPVDETAATTCINLEHSMSQA